MSRTCIFVPVVSGCCKDNCFSMKVSAPQKPKHDHKLTRVIKIVIRLSTDTKGYTNGLEMIMTNRFKLMSNFWMGNRFVNLDTKAHKFISRGPTHKKCHLFKKDVKSTQWRCWQIACHSGNWWAWFSWTQVLWRRMQGADQATIEPKLETCQSWRQKTLVPFFARLFFVKAGKKQPITLEWIL